MSGSRRGQSKGHKASLNNKESRAVLKKVRKLFFSFFSVQAYGQYALKYKTR